MQKESIREKGERACLLGHRSLSNPYLPYSVDWFEWLAGYVRASIRGSEWVPKSRNFDVEMR